MDDPNLTLMEKTQKLMSLGLIAGSVVMGLGHRKIQSVISSLNGSIGVTGLRIRTAIAKFSTDEYGGVSLLFIRQVEPLTKMEKCDLCGNSLIAKRSGLNSGLFCEKCGSWSIVTTCLPEIFGDLTVYSVFVVGIRNPSKDQVRCIAKVGGFNFLRACEVLSSAENAIFEGKAVEVVEKLRILEEHKIVWRTQPEFPFDISLEYRM